MSDTPNNIFAHDPQAILDYSWDWSVWLATGETITTKTVTASSGITLGSGGIVGGTVVTQWVNAVTAGTARATLTCHITTSAARQDDRTITLHIVDR